jgi:hypothetical protein
MAENSEKKVEMTPTVIGARQPKKAQNAATHLWNRAEFL